MNRYSFGALIIIGLALRMVLATTTAGNYDAISYGIVVDVLERSGNIYAETHRYNYSPLWSYLLLAMSYVAAALSLPLAVVVRTSLAVLDVCNALLIGSIARSRSATVLYLLSPVAVLIVGYHGQFDTLAASPLLTILVLQHRKRLGWRSLLALGSLAILIKHNTVFAVWTLFVMLLPLHQAILLMAAATIPFLLSFVPYLPDGAPGIVQNVVLYDGINGSYGLSALFPVAMIRPIFFAAMLLLPLLLKRVAINLQRSLLVSFLAFLSLSHGIGVQYFLFPALFGSLNPTRWHALFSGITTATLVMYYTADIPAWNFAWVIIAGWFLSHFLQLRFGVLQPASLLNEASLAFHDAYAPSRRAR